MIKQSATKKTLALTAYGMFRNILYIINLVSNAGSGDEFMICTIARLSRKFQDGDHVWKTYTSVLRSYDFKKNHLFEVNLVLK